MKLAFLQSGMPEWSHEEIANCARELGFDGIGLGRKNLHPGTSDDELGRIKELYADADIEIQTLNVHSRPAFPGISSDDFDWDEIEAELVPIARLAARLGCPSIYVSVQRPVSGVKWNWEEYLNNLAQAALNSLAEASDVRAVFQNHVGSASATQLLDLVERVGDAKLGVAFSPDHCVVMQEDPVQLAEEHASAIHHVCMADRKVVEEDLGKFDGRYYYVRYECCVVGEGIVPTARMLEALGRGGFKGYVTLKWEKSDVGTGPHLPNGYNHHLPMGDIVLPSFAGLMRQLGVGQKRP